jgi:hypothetical protein
MEQVFLPGTLSCIEAVANHDAILHGGFVVSLYSVGIAERIVVKTELANRVTR